MLHIHCVQVIQDSTPCSANRATAGQINLPIKLKCLILGMYKDMRIAVWNAYTQHTVSQNQREPPPKTESNFAALADFLLILYMLHLD
jgi:hypothetical protein